MKQGDTRTMAQALAELDSDFDETDRIVNSAVKVPLNQNQFDSLSDFCFNVGPGVPGVKDGFVWLKDLGPDGQPQHSTMLRKLNAGDYTGAAAEFPKWVRGGGRKLPGLVTRRRAERELFEKET